MISNFLLVLAAGVISAALRTYHHPVVFRLGTLGVIATSFLAGWLLGGEVWLGFLCASTWFLLPWLEILTRLRHLRLPEERILTSKTPPSRNVFPSFEELTDEIEENGFEHMQDVGWEFDDNKQFHRVFNSEKGDIQASISLTEQSEMAFYYISMTSRTEDGRIYMTWNYPFSYGLQMTPKMHIHRISGEQTIHDILLAHQAYLQKEGIEVSTLVAQSSESLLATMQGDIRAQISHNLSAGLLKRDSENCIRYTFRGMFFLWIQCLREFVRFS
jgi:hypothetical protein